MITALSATETISFSDLSTSRIESPSAFRALKAEGLSILLVDKSLKEIVSVADSAVIIERGETVWQGGIDALTPDLTDRYLGV